MGDSADKSSKTHFPTALQGALLVQHHMPPKEDAIVQQARVGQKAQADSILVP